MIFTFVLLFANWFLRNKEFYKQKKWLQISMKVGLGMVFALSWGQIFFGIFEGMVQAFVLTMLTLTYISVAVQE